MDNRGRGVRVREVLMKKLITSQRHSELGRRANNSEKSAMIKIDETYRARPPLNKAEIHVNNMKYWQYRQSSRNPPRRPSSREIFERPSIIPLYTV